MSFIFRDLASGAYLLRLGYSLRAHLRLNLQPVLFTVITTGFMKLSSFMLFTVSICPCSSIFLNFLIYLFLQLYWNSWPFLLSYSRTVLYFYFKFIFQRYRVSWIDLETLQLFVLASRHSLFSGSVLSQKILFTEFSPFAIGCSILLWCPKPITADNGLRSLLWNKHYRFWHFRFSHFYAHKHVSQ